MDFSFSFDSSKDFSFNSTHENDEVKTIVPSDTFEKSAKRTLVDKIISVYLKHNLSLEALEDVMDLYNDDREDCVKLPTKKKSILKLFRENRDMLKVFYVVKCETCKKGVSIDSDSVEKIKCCDKALNKTESNFFIYLPVQDQISQSLKEHWSCIQSFAGKISEDSEYISDVYDGEVLKKILAKYKDSDTNILSLCLNVDGAKKFKSNGYQLWPVQLLQNYLPPQIRFQTRNILVSGLYYGRTKADCNELLMPLVDEMNNLNKAGFELDISGETFTFNPIISHCAADLPVKSMLQQFKQHGGYNSCGYCKITGELVSIKRKQKNKKGKNVNVAVEENKFVRYVEGNEDCQPRDEVETLQQMLVASKSKGDVDGIKDVSCLVAFQHFNIIHSVSVEYMHCVLQGVIKQIAGYLLDSKFSSKSFYISPKSRKILDKRLLALKPPAYIVRKPRSLEDRSNFKASEYRFLLLYYLPVCLNGLVDNVYVQHVRRLSAAVYILLQTKIPKNEVNEAEKLLHRFVKDHQAFFSKEAMVTNVHLLKHLAESVRQLGPLWSHSAFPFERNNGVLLKMVNGTTDVLLQISSKYTLSKSVVKKVENAGAKILLGKSEKLVDKSLHVLNTKTQQKLDLSNVELSIHKRIRLEKIVYTSLVYTRPNKSVDYFIGLDSGEIGMAKFYIEHNSEIYVVMDEFETIDTISHIIKVRSNNHNIMSPIANINVKFIYMKIGPNQFICSAPNPYEIE